VAAAVCAGGKWKSDKGGKMSENPTPPTPRGKPSCDGRFVWQSSLALEKIVNELGAVQAAYGIAVYVALCRLSSQAKNDPRVSAPISKIAGMTRLGYRKTLDILHALQSRAKVIEIEADRQAASTYILLSTRLHPGKSGEAAGLHNVHTPGLPIVQRGVCTRRTSSHADNPKERALRALNQEIPSAPLGCHALGAQAPAGEEKPRTPFTAIEGWRPEDLK
jgi:hypothetical protein